MHLTPEAFSACLNLLVWWGGAKDWLRAARCHSACGPLLWWVHSASGHKELMAAGIMQWHARRLSPLLASLLPPLPFKRAEAKLGIPARFDQTHLNALAPTWKQNRDFCFTLKASFPSPGPHTCPAGGKVVVRIYNCRSRWYLQSVKPVKTSVFIILKANIKLWVVTESKWTSNSKLDKVELQIVNKCQQLHLIGEQ